MTELRRIAWVGPAPSLGAGVPYAATQFLLALTEAGVAVDCFIAGTRSDVPEILLANDRLRFFAEAPRWRAGAWYSRDPLTTFVTGQVARARAQRRLIGRLREEHAREAYALVYQFSQPELLALRKLRRVLPPIAVHPEVHAAGELRWHRREAAIAKRCMGRPRYMVVTAMLAARSAVQRRDLREADVVIAPSARFGYWLDHDYGIDPTRVRVVPNPVDLERFSPADQPAATGARLQLLYASRLSVRKGLDLVVGLSHRLADLEDRVEIRVVGDRTQWSDYRPLLADANPGVLRYDGPVEPAELPARYRAADLLLQPSSYEPFALTVAEALASGVPVIAADEVGAAEFVPASVCTTFEAGSLDAFEAAVRARIADLERGLDLRASARSEAERAFSRRVVGALLASRLAEAAA